MMTGFKETKNEKGIIFGSLKNGGQDKEDKEVEKKDHGESGSGKGHGGWQFSTKAEANEYLTDLSDNSGLANWVAGEARDRPRRNGNKKIEVASQVVRDGEGRKNLRVDEFLAPENRMVHIGNVWPTEELLSNFSELKIEGAPSSDPQEISKQTCNSSEDDQIAGDRGVNKTKNKKNKGNKCIFCSQKSHLAKDCPEEDIVQEFTSNFCLRCGDSGHDFFSCHNDYSADDLERIQCYVCKAFGHLCCASYGHGAPGSVSCYSCGESNHLGSECQKNLPETSSGSDRCNDRQECKKLPEEGSGSTSALVQYPNDHLAQECNRNKSEKAKEASGPVHVPKLANIPVPRTYIPRFEPPSDGPQVMSYNPPYRVGLGPQKSQKEVSGPTIALPPGAPKLAKIPKPKTFVPRFEPVPHRFSNGPENHVLRYNPPYRFGYVPQSNVSRYNPPRRFAYVPRNNVPRRSPPPSFGTGPPLFWHNEMINAQESSQEWSTYIYPQQQRPMAADQGNEPSSSGRSSQSSVEGQSSVEPQQSPES